LDDAAEVDKVGTAEIGGVDGARDVAFFLTGKEAPCDMIYAAVLARVSAAHDGNGGGVVSDREISNRPVEHLRVTGS
jgi:hypothetical protein